MNINNIISIVRNFSTQGANKKNYINIGKMIKKQLQESANNTNNKSSNKKGFRFGQNKSQENQIDQLESNSYQQFHLKHQNYSTQNPNLQQTDFQNKKFTSHQHMSTEGQQFNYKIKSSIRSQSIYYLLQKNKHKFQPKHYSLMFIKILQLRKLSQKERQDQQEYISFLRNIQKKIDNIVPEDLIKMLHEVKVKFINKEEIKFLLPILQKIVDQFANQQSSQLLPKSFQTLSFSSNMKLYRSLYFILIHTGSYFQTRIKKILNQMIQFLLNQNMKKLNIFKQGQITVQVSNFMFLLYTSKQINASRSVIRKLLYYFIVKRKNLIQFQELLIVQKALYENYQLFKSFKNQLLTASKQRIQSKNLIYKIQRQIFRQFVKRYNQGSGYSILTSRFVNHLEYINKRFNYNQLVALDLYVTKDQESFFTLKMFHEGYNKYFTQTFSSQKQEQQLKQFFKTSQSSYTLYYFLSNFYQMIKKDGIDSLKPTIKKQLKDLINILCKFFSRLNFMVQSVVIEYLFLYNYTNLKPFLLEYFQYNTEQLKIQKKKQKKQQEALSQDKIKDKKKIRQVSKYYFFAHQNQLHMNKFFQMIQYEQKYKEFQCEIEYQTFLHSNIKKMLNYIFKSKQMLNIEKNAYYIAYLWKNKQQLNMGKNLIQTILTIYADFSSQNTSFTQQQVQILYKNKQYNKNLSQTLQIKQLKDQTNIFDEQNQFDQHKQDKNDLMSNLQNDRQIFRQNYDLDMKIRGKIRKMIKNFKFLVLLLQNIKSFTLNQQLNKYINGQVYPKIIKNFKSQIQYLKFQKLFTKQNYLEIQQITLFLKQKWLNTPSKIQINNQAMVYKRNAESYEQQNDKIQKQKQKRGKLNMQSAAREQEYQKTVQQQAEQQQDEQAQKQEDQIDQQQQQSQDEQQAAQEIQTIKTIDITQLNSYKIFQEKQVKKANFFKNKNKEVLAQIGNITNNFTQIEEPQNHSQQNMMKNIEIFRDLQLQKLKFVKSLSQLYEDQQLNEVSKNKLEQKRSSIKIINLPSIDQQTLQKQNYSQIMNFKLQSQQKRFIYQIKVLSKIYPNLLSFSLLNNQKIKQKRNNSHVYYVYTKKSKIGIKRKEQEEQENATNQNALKGQSLKLTQNINKNNKLNEVS